MDTQTSKTPTQQQMGEFLRANLLDMVLVLVLSLSLVYAVLSGFDATLPMRTNFGLEALVSCVLLVILYAGAWSHKVRAISIVCAIAYFVAVLVVSLVMTSSEAAPFADGRTINDVEGNYAIFAITVLVITLLTYLLSRSSTLVVILALISVFTCCVVQYLFRDWAANEGGVIDFVIVLVISVSLIVYRRYRISSDAAEHKANTAYAQTFAFGVVISGVVVAISAVLFALVIAPLNLQTPVIKPFEVRIIPPIEDYTGTYDEYLVENPEEFTSLLNEREDETNQNTKGGSVPDNEETQTDAAPIIQFLKSMTIFSEDDWTEVFDPTTINRIRLGLTVALLLLVAIIAAAIALRIHWREVRLKKLSDKPYSMRVISLYDFLLSRLDRLKLGKPATSTPLEFAFDSRRKLAVFTRNTNKVDLVEITLIYQRATYGKEDVSKEEYERVVRYYREFFKNAHRFVGTPKWMYLFWRI